MLGKDFQRQSTLRPHLGCNLVHDTAPAEAPQPDLAQLLVARRTRELRQQFLRWPDDPAQLAGKPVPLPLPGRAGPRVPQLRPRLAAATGLTRREPQLHSRVSVPQLGKRFCTNLIVFTRRDLAYSLQASAVTLHSLLAFVFKAGL